MCIRVVNRYRCGHDVVFSNTPCADELAIIDEAKKLKSQRLPRRCGYKILHRCRECKKNAVRPVGSDCDECKALTIAKALEKQKQEQAEAERKLQEELQKKKNKKRT